MAGEAICRVIVSMTLSYMAFKFWVYPLFILAMSMLAYGLLKTLHLNLFHAFSFMCL